MPLTKCAECNGRVSTSARFCPHCGAPIDKAVTFLLEPNARGRLWSIIILFFFIAALFVSFSFLNPSSRSQESQAAEMAAYFLRNYFQERLGVKDRFLWEVNPEKATVTKAENGNWIVRGAYTVPPKHNVPASYMINLRGPNSSDKWTLVYMEITGSPVYSQSRWTGQ